MKNDIGWAITLKYGKEKEEILHALIYSTRFEALRYYRQTDLYKPEYKIRKVKIILA